MIGIKVQNFVWERALLDLLGDQAEKYQEDHTYDILISDTKTSIKSLVLGKDLPTPIRLDVLKDKIEQARKIQFENNFFKWLPQTRQLIHKKTQNMIQLTEKESEIICFLAQCPKHQATKEEILKAVWHYQNDIHTHTLESHIYTLRQKLAPDSDKVIVANDRFYTLI